MHGKINNVNVVISVSVLHLIGSSSAQFFLQVTLNISHSLFNVTSKGNARACTVTATINARRSIYKQTKWWEQQKRQCIAVYLSTLGFHNQCKTQCYKIAGKKPKFILYSCPLLHKGDKLTVYSIINGRRSIYKQNGGDNGRECIAESLSTLRFGRIRSMFQPTRKTALTQQRKN